MRKSEMNDWQSTARDAFVTRLSTSRWNAGGWELLFLSDHSLSPEAQAEYQNNSFDLRCSYYVADDYVLWEAVARVGELAITLRLYPAGAINELVDTIVACQDTVNDDNYPAFVDMLKPHCRFLLFQTRDQLIEIT